jgi:hypothetical protein
MGHIKEPKGIDFVVDPTPLTTKDRERISEIIAYYKSTGRKIPPVKKPHRTPESKKKKIAA